MNKNFFLRKSNIHKYLIIQCKEMCMLPREKGPCKDEQEKFYFETKTGKCEKFTFGGCFGNLNNFESLDECESTCHALIEMAMSAKPVAVNMGINKSDIFLGFSDSSIFDETI